MISELLQKNRSALLALIVGLFALALFGAAQSGTVLGGQDSLVPRKALDFDFFQCRVEPVFLNYRSPEHARCYSCHEETKHHRLFHLAKLEPGKRFWTEQQSRQNFETLSHLVVAGSPLKSLLLLHPLAPEAGGDAVYVHSGGRQFESQSDPDWQTMAEWVLGKTAGACSPSSTQ
jgi:hypothetical protein